MINNKYIDHVKDILNNEFKRIGIPIDSFNINSKISIDYFRVNHKNNIDYLPTGQCPIAMEVVFSCDQSQYNYLKPFVKINKEHTVHLPQDVRWQVASGDLNPIDSVKSNIKIVHECKIVLYLTGGSMRTFIESFRLATDELFVAIESKVFDEEVLNVLSEK